jgi:hypothetical protein
MVGASLTLLCRPYESTNLSQRHMCSSLRSAHSWLVQVDVLNVTLGATAKQRDGDQPQSG